MTYAALTQEAASLWADIESDLAPMRRAASSRFTTDSALEVAREALQRARARMDELAEAMRV